MSELPSNAQDNEGLDKHNCINLTPPRFSPRRSLSEIMRYGATGALSFASSSALEIAALTGAGLLVGINPFMEWDSRMAAAAMILSYIPLSTGTLQHAYRA